ncbi:hypothetical protein NL676_012480 [Syzygium grande]|nr:hypothetical protein NL676_012480 [Syzygium grande]
MFRSFRLPPSRGKLAWSLFEPACCSLCTAASEKVNVVGTLLGMNESDTEKETEWERLLKPFDLEELRKSLTGISPYQLCKLLVLPIDVPMSMELFERAGAQKNYSHTFDVYCILIDKLGAAKEFKIIDRLLLQMKEEQIAFRESLFLMIMKHYGRASLPGQATRPDVRTFNDILGGLCKFNRIHEAAKLFDRMLLRGFTPDGFTYGVLIHALCKVGKVDEARALWDKMPSSDVVLFNTMLSGYVMNGRFDEAKSLFCCLLDSPYKPDVFSYNILIYGLCKKGHLHSARDLVNEMEDNGCKPNVVTYTMLIDALCKLGYLNEANCLLTEMTGREST